MNKCIIYSGHLRTWQQVKTNHRECIGIGNEVHYNETDADMDFYNGLEWEHYRENKVPETTPNSTVNQWHNMFMAFCRAKKGFDVYIRMRYDIMLSGPIDFESLSYGDNRVYIPTGHDYHHGVNDQMAFGSYEAMRKYYSVYLLHPLLFSQGKQFHTESYLRYALDHQKMDIIRIPITTTIVRL